MLKLALLITSCSIVVYLYGLLSPVTTVAFLVISAALLALATLLLHGNFADLNKAILESETRHYHAGQYYRSYLAPDGALWFRDSDIRHGIHCHRSRLTMKRMYSSQFRKINPLVDAWYVHQDALRSMTGSQLTQNDTQALQWLEKEVIQVNKILRSMEGQKPIQDRSADEIRTHWLKRYWHGQLGLFVTLAVGGLPIIASIFLIYWLYPEEFVMHYQFGAFLSLTSIFVTAFLLFIWGHGLIMATLHWLASGRSFVIATFSVVAGSYCVILSLEQFVKQYEQYSIAEWFSILADTDEKPHVYYEKKLQAVIIDGPLSYGTTISLLDALEKSPKTNLIGLISPGGRVDEGKSINQIIEKRKMDTLVLGTCASSCVIAYVAGQNRHAHPNAWFGLHRSGFHWHKEDVGITETDIEIAMILEEAGVHEWLIIKGMTPSIHGIYNPTVQEALDANLATATWPPSAK